MDDRQKHRRLGELLIEKGLVTAEALREALAEQERTGEFLGTILVNHSIIKDEDLAKTLSEQFQMPFVRLKDTYFHWEFVSRFSSSLITEHSCFPLSSDDWSVTFAIINPLDVWALKKAEEESKGLKPKFVVVSGSDMREAVARYRQYARGSINKLF
jgi:type IV pilus assembly protein PilB